MTMSGMVRVAGSFLRARATSNPSGPGHHQIVPLEGEPLPEELEALRIVVHDEDANLAGRDTRAHGLPVGGFEARKPCGNWSNYTSRFRACQRESLAPVFRKPCQTRK